MMDFFLSLPFWVLASILGGSFMTCGLLVLTQGWHGRLSLDSDLLGAQKIHQSPVPRVGGMGLMVALGLGCVVGFALNSKTYPWALTILICALPVFISGLSEDLTKRVSVNSRLMASFISAALGVWLLDARLTSVDTPLLDWLLQYPTLSILFTCFAVGGVTHSINIIDGLNGLAAGSVSLMLSGLAAIAWMHGDLLVMKLCLWGIAAMVGFLLLNYPFGRIFLGDGGAYLAGFWVAECSVLLLVRNPQISTWAVLLACFYPVWETLYSAYRRHVIGHASSGQADMGHLHHLIFKQLSSSRTVPAWLRHGVSSGTVWLMVLSCQLTALLFFDNTPVLVLSIMALACIYHLVYVSLSAKERALERPGKRQGMTTTGT